MMDPDEDARSRSLAKLEQSRAELRLLLDPPRHQPTENDPLAGDAPQHFPRSRTMRILMSARGLGTVGAVVGGLLIARPALALRLLRMLPAGAVARTLVLKAFTTLRARQA